MARKKKKAKNMNRNNSVSVHGQEYQAFGSFAYSGLTTCVGVRHYDIRPAKFCSNQVEKQLGVLEPRCPDCYREQIEWNKSQKK